MEIATQSIRTACADLNGQMRGKRLPASHAARLEISGLRMPLSVLNLDLWGEDITESPLVLPSGDADGQLRVTERDPVPMPWLPEPATLVPLWMFTDEGLPFEGDPRHALSRVLARFSKRGWKVTAATEVEFTLLDDSGDILAHARDPRTRRRLGAGAINSVESLDRFAVFFDDLYAGAEAMEIKAQSAVSEAGIGQFEVDLEHGPAMRVADDTWLFKALVRGTARKHGMAATFMAKPFEDDYGNGMHLHFSVLDGEGRNIFDNGMMTGTTAMRQAVAGCLAAMPGSTLVFAPHLNSYARTAPGAHAPTGAAWGYENRTTALRIPGGEPASRRIEHRVAGGDTNPYLVMAAVLGAALMGIEDGLTPPEPILGNAYEQRVLQVPSDWQTAIDRFSASPKMARIFPRRLIENLVMTKRQEWHRMTELTPAQQIRSILSAM
jgi:glutamine synthetase